MTPVPTTTGCTLGILGLGLLSRNLILTIARQGFKVAGYDSNPQLVAELRKSSGDLPVLACDTIREFTGHLSPPRSILILVQGGPQLEVTFRELGDYLDAGDLMIDGASYHHIFTPRRRLFFAGHGAHFLSTGIAATGNVHQYGCSALYPELQETCRRIRPLFESAATKAPGEPCVTFVGRQIEQQLRRLEKAGAELLPSAPEGAV
jgi:6-phosphogluconate dehydrogenase